MLQPHGSFDFSGPDMVLVPNFPVWHKEVTGFFAGTRQDYERAVTSFPSFKRVIVAERRA